MSTPNPMASLPPPPSTSKTTMHMAGLLVDVYGLSALHNPHLPSTASLLWLHHPRLRSKEDMADTAARALAAWSAHPPTPTHALIALAFDQRNHGTRIAHPAANEAWRQGNPHHAPDMLSVVAGTVADTRALMDVVAAYLFPAGGVRVVQHLVLGVSLGGHSGWQLMFAEERVAAGVLVVGCPDYMGLLQDRARLSKLETYQTEDAGASFLGSTDFPPALVEACEKLDPKGIFFSTGNAAWPGSLSEEYLIRQKLIDHGMTGKKFLVCSGGDDKLVPYRCGEDFMIFFKKAAQSWPDLRLEIEDKVYPGVGHMFSAAMVEDAVRFIVDAVIPFSKQTNPRNGDERTSKM